MVESKYVLSTVIKSVLIVMLLLCFLDMPHAYYTILRIVVTLSMAWLDNIDNEEKNFGRYCFYVFVGIMFNPVFVVELERIIWQITDITLAVIFLVMLIIQTVKQYSY